MAEALLDGKTVSTLMLKRIRHEVLKLKKRGIRPKLAFILVGNNPASLAYVSQKEKACRVVGIEFRHIKLPAKVSTQKLSGVIEKLNRERNIHGILVQLPLPQNIDTEKIIRAISPEKDVDGFHPMSLFTPCTPTGVLKLLDHYKIPIEGRHAVVVGKSNIVGKPLAFMLLKRGATVTICHRKTKPLAKYTREADILCVAAGVPSLINANMVKKGCVVVDVGFNRLKSGKIVGDVAFDSVKKKARFITPVPGGVGPMTVSCLMENVVKAARNKV